METVCRILRIAVPPTIMQIAVTAPWAMPQPVRSFLLGSMLPLEVSIERTKVAEFAAPRKQKTMRRIARGAVTWNKGSCSNRAKRPVV